MNFVTHRHLTAAGPALHPRRRGVVLGDFALRDGRIFLRKTGNSARLDRRLMVEVATWVGFYLSIRLRSLVRRPAGPRLSIWFVPQVPHARYMVRAAAIYAGIGVARSAAAADASFFFDDATSSTPPPAGHQHGLNFGCGDISKSRVAATFGEVFGYPLAVDPTCWLGLAVAKSETNGTHDGRIVECPCLPESGVVYQRLVDSVRSDGFAYDLRTHVIAGEVVAVWIKQRAVVDRFLPPNISAKSCRPDEVFSRAELRSIGAFAKAMGADWCGLDILRDEPSGRIYIVDVNKTDAGPIIALPLAEKLASTRILAAALRRLIEAQPAASSIADSASMRASKAA